MVSYNFRSSSRFSFFGKRLRRALDSSSGPASASAKRKAPLPKLLELYVILFSRSSGLPLVSNPSAPAGIPSPLRRPTHRAWAPSDWPSFRSRPEQLPRVVNSFSRRVFPRARHDRQRASPDRGHECPPRFRSRWRRATAGSTAFTPTPSRSRAPHRPMASHRDPPPGSSRWPPPTTSSSSTSTAPSRRSTWG